MKFGKIFPRSDATTDATDGAAQRIWMMNEDHDPKHPYPVEMIFEAVPDGYAIAHIGDLYMPVPVDLEIEGDTNFHTSGYFTHPLSGSVEAYMDEEQARTFLWHQQGARGARDDQLTLPLPGAAHAAVRLT